MAAQNFLLAEEELSCPICFEEFNLHEKCRQPKLLLCLHTFCLSCMETLRKYDGTLQCSICRTSHLVYKVSDLMDNYVIFEHLKVKQEHDDEKLAVQLKQEYEESMRILREQEERDAQLAREEEEKNRLEEEKRKQEEEKRKQEEERRIEEENLRKRQEEERRLEIQKENEKKMRQEIERKMNDEKKKREEERRNEEIKREESNSLTGHGFDDEESSTSDESLGTESSDESDDSDDSVSVDDEDEFQDLTHRYTDNEHEDGEEEDESPTSVVDQENYETLSSDTDQSSSVYVVSSDEDPPNERYESRSKRNSPEPDLLSEEFSGVAKKANPSSKAAQEPINPFLSKVNFKEEPDGQIIILDSSIGESQSSEDTPESPRRHFRRSLKIPSFSSMTDEESDVEGAVSKTGFTPSSSSEDERRFARKTQQSGSNSRNPYPISLDNDPECQLQ